MGYDNTRPQSAKGQVYTAYMQGGDAAAHAKGKALGVPQKVKRWIGLFNDAGDVFGGKASIPYDQKPPEQKLAEGKAVLRANKLARRKLAEAEGKKAPENAPTPPVQRDPTPTPAKGRGKAKIPHTPSGRRVYDTGNPNIHGTVVKAGPEVSEVRFDGHRDVTNVPNQYLADADSEPDAKTRRTFLAATCFRVAHRDHVITTTRNLQEAFDAAGDDPVLWVFAVTAGGGVALLQRAHWPQYLAMQTKAAA